MSLGKIIKGIGGFYYVESADIVYECKARGSFRKQKITPLVGDNVEFSVNENAENTIDAICPRKNELVRPPLANLDTLFIVSSVTDPKINTLIIDKLTAIAEHKNIEPVIVITKTDLDSSYIKYKEIYEKSGFTVIACNNITGEGCDAVKSMLKGKISAFTGNTGVGKSSLLNALFPHLELPTGETSKKLGRGRHTTRHCELFKVEGGYIADTPGFSSLDFERCEKILKDDLPYCFRDFRDYLGECKFNSCSHINDKGCAVVQAVKDGIICDSRHNSYISMYNDVKDIKKWENK
ncbi:MAG: ribosome small subunit-dependent GTPase A [Eubacterium sp.]